MKLYCLMTKSQYCERFIQGCCVAVAQQTIEQTTSQSQVWRSAVAPPGPYNYKLIILKRIRIFNSEQSQLSVKTLDLHPAHRGGPRAAVTNKSLVASKYILSKLHLYTRNVSLCTSKTS